ncbi:hypothetical protein N431DRAFT_60710 [Stipitochalara longipes BDJ]|nr:hypothetical protein N431DRAFT_60710 [Stipitochalara longipes BDJ]
MSSIRRFMGFYFYYALISFGDDHLEDPNCFQYSIGEMHQLAGDIPDLNNDFFRNVQRLSCKLETKGRKSLEPWSLIRYYFHNHLRRIGLSCPGSLVVRPLKQGDDDFGSQVHYILQATPLKGGQICNVFKIARDLEKTTSDIIQEVDAWIQLGVMDWVDDRVTFKLASPMKEPDVKKETCQVSCSEPKGVKVGIKV